MTVNAGSDVYEVIANSVLLLSLVCPWKLATLLVVKEYSTVVILVVVCLKSFQKLMGSQSVSECMQ